MLRKDASNYAYSVHIVSNTGKVTQNFKIDNAWSSGANGKVRCS